MANPLTVSSALDTLDASADVIAKYQYMIDRERIIRNNNIVDAIDNKVAYKELQRRTKLSRQQLVNIGLAGKQHVPAPWKD